MKHTTKKTSAIATQDFNGQSYYLYKGEKYFTRHEKRLHVAVWGYHNGPVPKGYHIHHKDENKHNNCIDNLECMEGAKHISMHAGAKDSWINSSDGQQHQKRNIELAKAWHASPEGIAWHKQHAIAKGFGKFDYGQGNCEYCSASYTRKTKRARFCSNNCKTQYRRVSGVDRVQRVCRHCGSAYGVSKYSKTVFCSVSCAALFRNS